MLKNLKRGGGSFGAVLPAGTRMWTLVDLEEHERPAHKWSKGPNGKPVKGPPTGENEPAVRFKFEIEDAELGHAEASRPFALVFSGGMVKFLEALAPGKIDKDMDPEDVMRIANSLIGHPFLLSTVPNDKYNNIQTAMPVPVGMVAQTQKPVQQALVRPVEFDDSDIPF